MSQRKRHHYIPQFYLRKFSYKNNGKQIGVFNYSNNLYISTAPIKYQAYEKYLYVDDEIEIALGKLEEATSYIFNKIFEVCTPPPADHPLMNILKEFIYFQHTRTIKAGDETIELLNSSFQAMFKLNKDYEEKYKDIRLKHEHPVLMTLMETAKGLPFMSHLTCKIIVNQSSLAFITSDNPVVKYNQLMELRGLQNGTTGIACKGLQIFFPIHPSVMIVLYDPYVYKMGKQNEVTLITKNEHDIHQLNILQYLSSRSQLFFNHEIKEPYLKGLTEKYKDKKRKLVSESITIPNKVVGNDGQRHLLLNSRKEMSVRLSLSFMSISKAGKKFTLDNRLVYPRHPDLIKIGEILREKDDYPIIDEMDSFS